MSFLISLLTIARSLTFVTHLFGGGDGDIGFAQPVFLVSGNEVRLHCLVQNALPQELKPLAATGGTVPLYIYVSVRRENDKALVRSMLIENRLLLDLKASRFRVARSCVPETLTFASLDSAAKSFATVTQCPVLNLKECEAGQRYYFEAYAILGEMKVAALNDSKVDLMYYWNFKRPSFRTEPLALKGP